MIRLAGISHETTLTYQPALDGVRAVAVALVLLFHAGFVWMPAGYLGVSTFFTLSGFLITGLLLGEHTSTGRVSLSRFYTRRARRLVPASITCIALVLMGRSLGLFGRVASLKRDSVSALLQVFNWSRLAGTTSYADLFNTAHGSTTSPLEHYWSLSVEEQFYVLWPLALLCLVAFAKRHRWPIARPIAAVTIVFVAAAPLTAKWFGADAAYWATPARFAEILLGATLAAWMTGRRSAPPWVRHLAPAALGAIVWLACTLPSGSGPAYEGFLPVFALLSVALIYALQVPGAVRSLLSTRPFVAVGRISYGLYLFHWPIFVAMRQNGWQLTSPSGFLAALAATVVVTVTSYVVIELPIRIAVPRPSRTFVFAAVAMVMATVVVVVVPAPIALIHVDAAAFRQASLRPATQLIELRANPTAPTSTVAVASMAPLPPSQSAATGVDGDASLSPSAVSDAAPDAVPPFDLSPAVPPAPSRPVRVLVVGDSTALFVAHGLAVWSMNHPQHEQLSVLWCQGCGFVLDGTVTSFDATSFVAHSKQIVGHDLPSSIARVKPDVVILMSTVDDVANREWTRQEGPLSASDPRFRAHLLDAYRMVTSSVLKMGVARVDWIIPPVPTLEWKEPEMRERSRYELQHDVIRQVAAEQSAHVTPIDVDQWMNRAGHAGDKSWRPDGVHFTEDSAARLAELYLGPVVVAGAIDGSSHT